MHLNVVSDDAAPEHVALDNDDVFVMAGGVPPFKLLEQCHVSFDPADRDTPPPIAEHGTGILGALYVTLLLSLAILAWILVFREYYGAAEMVRPVLDVHQRLRPSSPFGLVCGSIATVLILANLLYLVRRRYLFSLPGNLSTWMTAHVVTGVLALLVVFIHGTMAPQTTLGGHAFYGLLMLVITGAIGRYFYSFVPRAVNGKEMAMEELNAEIAAESTQWDRIGRGFGERARTHIHELVAEGRWSGSFLNRLWSLLRTQRAARRTYRRLRHDGRREGLSHDQVEKIIMLAQRAYRTALLSSHYEDLRALLNSWRFFHRWVALLMVLTAALHITVALVYGRMLP